MRSMFGHWETPNLAFRNRGDLTFEEVGKTWGFDWVGVSQGIALADLFCREARVRIDRLFDAFYGADDRAMYRVAQQVLRGEHAWLETGIISPLEDNAETAPTEKTERIEAGVGD